MPDEKDVIKINIYGGPLDGEVSEFEKKLAGFYMYGGLIKTYDKPNDQVHVYEVCSGDSAFYVGVRDESKVKNKKVFMSKENIRSLLKSGYLSPDENV